MKRPANVFTLNKLLTDAEKGRYAVGSFSPRYIKMIRPVLRAAQSVSSPLIVQISEKEFKRYFNTPEEFAAEFYQALEQEKITVPVALHLDHTKDREVIVAAINAGFTSVMIDASEMPLDENISITRDIVEYAHPQQVSVEAELGRIGTTDFVETDTDEELFTVPEQAKRFVDETRVDALAVSVGTAHGVYNVRAPRVDFPRLQQIRDLTPVHLVLHGGSGVPPEMLKTAMQINGGGISKVNIATDLELAFLKAIGREKAMTDAGCNELAEDLLHTGRAAVEAEVRDKIQNSLGSANRA